MNSETKILLPFTWPIVLRSEAKYNTQNLCCAVTTNSKEGRPDFELPCGVVRLSKFLIVCLFGFGSHPCPPPASGCLGSSVFIFRVGFCKIQF